MKTSVPNYKKILLLLAIDLLVSLALLAQSAPELVFRNPVLKSGTAGREGAVYRFANVTTGVDAEMKLADFSHSNITMKTVDTTGTGYDNAFQPHFGLGTNNARQNWYVDFEVTFLKAGTNNKVKLPKVEITALDIDGDNRHIHEYLMFDRPATIAYSSNTQLVSETTGNIGSTATCGECGKQGTLYVCSNCKGTGMNGSSPDDNCKGSGKLISGCSHSFTGISGNLVKGTTQTFDGISVVATQVMAMYTYLNVDKIKFRVGAVSSSTTHITGESAIRLNSIWFKGFSLKPAVTLPVQLLHFTAVYKHDAVELAWEAENEENFSHFIIERSAGNSSYAPVAIVFSKEQKTPSRYTYTDKKPGPHAPIKYRLVVVDKDKQSRYSDVRVVKTGHSQGLNLVVYPNPTADALQVSLPHGWEGKEVVVALFGSTGSRVKYAYLKSAGHSHTLQLTDLPRGFYIVKASSKGQFLQQQIIKN